MLTKIIQWLQNLDDWLTAERRARNFLKSPELRELPLEYLAYMVQQIRQDKEDRETAKMACRDARDHIESLRKRTYQHSPEAWEDARKSSEQRWEDAFKRAEESERINVEAFFGPAKTYKLHKDAYE